MNDFFPKLIKLSRRAFFVWGKMPNPPKRPILPLNSLHNFKLKYLSFYTKYQKPGWIGNFGGIHVKLMDAKFQGSSCIGVGRK